MSRIDLYGFLGVGLGLLVGMIGHELAHAWVAVRLGDPTPRMMGRLTLNPKAHADPFGTVILPGIALVSILFKSPLGFFFGYAKPVTIHPGRLRHPRRDALIVALAGPGFNLLVVALIGVVFRRMSSLRVLDVLFLMAQVNTYLFIINILPFPPLDGSKILTRFLSPSAAMKLESLSQYLIFFLIALFLIFSSVIANVAEAIYTPILGNPAVLSTVVGLRWAAR